jgi:HAD superfamily hydrolase (TIGR01549 family)
LTNLKGDRFGGRLFLFRRLVCHACRPPPSEFSTPLFGARVYGSLVQFDAYLVDLDGTLYSPLPVKLGMALELALSGWLALGPLKVFRHTHEELRELYSRGEVAAAGVSPFEQQLTLTASQLAVPEAKLRALVENWMLHRPQKWIRLFARKALLQELATFQASGGKLAVVSDYPATLKLQALPGSLRFDTVVSNGEPGGPSRLKPDPEGYLIAANRLQVRPERCLVLGDRSDADGEAARRAGMAFRLVK